MYEFKERFKKESPNNKSIVDKVGGKECKLIAPYVAK
jgi:hypothetical protein